MLSLVVGGISNGLARCDWPHDSFPATPYSQASCIMMGIHNAFCRIEQYCSAGKGLC